MAPKKAARSKTARTRATKISELNLDAVKQELKRVRTEALSIRKTLEGPDQRELDRKIKILDRLNEIAAPCFRVGRPGPRGRRGGRGR